MKKLHTSITIKAPVEKVWETIVGKDTYPLWTETFYPGSNIIDSWEKGSKVLFVGPNEHGKNDGMVSEIAEIRNLQAQRAQLTERMAVIQDLQGTRPVIVRLFDELVRRLPDGVYYNSITRSGESIQMIGVAESNNMVSELMRSLEASDWFANASLQQINAQNNDQESYVFQLQVAVTTPVQQNDQ